MDPLLLKKMLRRRMSQVDDPGMSPSPPPPGMGTPQLQGGPPGMPPGAPGGMPPQMSQSQFARPFSPEERMRQAMQQAEMLRRTGRQ